MADLSRDRRATEDWSAKQYLKFEDERTRPPRDLLAQVPLDSQARGRSRLRTGQLDGIADRAVSPRTGDRGRFLAGYVAAGARAAAALYIRRGRSFNLAAGAGHRSPVWQCRVPLGAGPSQGAGAAAASLPGGVLAVQMPDNTNEPALMLMEKVAAAGPWSTAIAQANAARNDLPRPEDYYDLLRPLCSRIDIWHTHYNHIIESHAGVVEWFKGRGCARSSPRSTRRCARRSPPGTPMRSGSPIRHVPTAGSC